MLELSKETRAQAVASILRYFAEEREEEIGQLAAEELLRYFLEEIGPCVYNRAVADVQSRLLARVEELDGEVFQEELAYWPRRAAKARGRR